MCGHQPGGGQVPQHPVQRPGQAVQEEEVVAVDPVQVRSRGRGHIAVISCSYKYFLCQPVLEQLQRRHEAAHQDLRGGARRVLRQVSLLLTNGSAGAGHVTRARPLIGCYVAAAPRTTSSAGAGRVRWRAGSAARARSPWRWAGGGTTGCRPSPSYTPTQAGRSV